VFYSRKGLIVVSQQSYSSGVPKKKAKLPLSKTHPKLAKEADGWDPRHVTSGSHKRLKWKCLNGHKYLSGVSDRARGTSCPFCSNSKVLAGFNDLKTKFPTIAKQADGWDPRTVISGSHKKLKWNCPKGHKYEASVKSRTISKSNCPVCSNQKVLAGFNDLKTKFPSIAKEADGWDPSTVVAGSNKKLSWKCSEGHRFQAVPNDRTSRVYNCPICSNHKVLAGFNDLKTKFPSIAKEADGWDPSTVIPGSDKKLKWKCLKGHSYISSPNGRTGGDRNCPICSNQKVLAGFNDLKTKFPSIAKEADGWDPRTVVAGSNKKLSWKCSEGHTYLASIGNRTKSNKTGCPICSNQKVLAGFNDLKTKFPSIAKEADGWDPSTVVAGSNKKFSWICSDGHKYSMVANLRTSRGSGCPTCAETGFDPNADGFLYFIQHPDWQMFQIGITNYPDDRLGRHRRLGWKTLEIRGPMDGHLTQQWETAILRMLKSKGADLSNSKIAGKFDGFTEAWSKSTFPVKSIKELMRLTEEFEGN